MIVRRIDRPGRRRRGHAAAELALLLPFLCFICLVAVDYARLVNALVTITNCARNGALYLSNQASYSTYYTDVTHAAQADAGGLSPTPTVSTANYTDSYGNACVTVTVNYTFTTLVNYPGIPSSTTLSRSVSMPVNN
jgi:Flp pilus assembly protein TadG